MDTIVHFWTTEFEMPVPTRQQHQAIGPSPLVLEADRFAGGKRRRLSGPGMRTFLGIANASGLSEGDRLRLLGLHGRYTYYGWVSRARERQDLDLSADTLLRTSAVFVTST